MGFAYEEPTSDTTDSSTSTSSVTTYEDYNESTSESSYSLDETATGTSGGFATSDPYSGETYQTTTEPTQQGGEHTYDVDNSDTQTTVTDDSGTVVGGEYTHDVEYEPETVTQVDPFTGGTIAGGLDGTQEQQQEQIDAISDLTHTDDGSHTTDQLQGDPVEMITGGDTSAEDVWNDTTPDVPSLPDVPEFPDPRDPDGIGVGLLLAAVVALYIGFREVVGSGA